MHYRIGEFGALSGVSAKTLRFYDEIGLLRPAGIDPRTRYRHYQPQQLAELAAILALKDLGLSLPEIRRALSKGNRRQMLMELKQSVEHSISAASRSLSWINAALDEVNVSSRLIPVVVKRRPAVQVASLRAKVATYGEILAIEQELLNAVAEESTGGLRGVLWHRCADSGSLEGEPFVELKNALGRRSLYHVKQLPPASLACAYSGADDDAEPAYEAIKRWMAVRHYKLAGPMREIYLDGMLEIQFPLQSA